MFEERGGNKYRGARRKLDYELKVRQNKVSSKSVVVLADSRDDTPTVGSVEMVGVCVRDGVVTDVEGDRRERVSCEVSA